VKFPNSGEDGATKIDAIEKTGTPLFVDSSCLMQFRAVSAPVEIPTMHLPRSRDDEDPDVSVH